LKGAASATLFLYDAGLNTWSTPTTLAAGETFTTGASTCLLPSRRKLWIQKEVSQRTYVLDLVTGQLDAGPFLPYSASAGYDGHRACYARAPSGFEWLYLLRASGQEFFRVPIEWF
jgi:hypothetical protein